MGPLAGVRKRWDKAVAPRKMVVVVHRWATCRSVVVVVVMQMGMRVKSPKVEVLVELKVHAPVSGACE